MIVEARYADEDICFMREKNASGGLAGPCVSFLDI
jgi:hypothetical protein